MPNELGIRKHPCFCLKRKKTNRDDTKNGLIKYSELSEEDIQNEDFSSALYHENLSNQENLRKTIKIKNLEKNFDTLIAVNNLSMCLYESQIFCLLGHNGAGKTTTINLLTGLINKTKGKVSIYNKDLDEELDDIRKSIGLCIQKDLLYENLTVEEHLNFMGLIKGLNNSEIESQIEYILEKV